ncbi:hypothetical protein P5673_027672 [Acropora cervicornis]|uniref:Uncharacterized protein n=1 Tax=Acropora cervicornis TaxID=6130 RepID=A0AAD9PZ05_ACRCE|nr:hypothetical protein P5673_027672 [Acropora cervicornis]
MFQSETHRVLLAGEDDKHLWNKWVINAEVEKSISNTSQDNWKINFRELYEAAYTSLWVSLLRIRKTDEALFAAEQGRAQTLSDNLLLQYELNSSSSSATIDTKETILRLFTKLTSPTLFLALEGFTTNIWFLRRGMKIIFRQGRLEGEDEKHLWNVSKTHSSESFLDKVLFPKWITNTEVSILNKVEISS